MTDSPVGRVAITVLSRREMVGWGKDAATPMAEGLLERSILSQKGRNEVHGEKESRSRHWEQIRTDQASGAEKKDGNEGMETLAMRGACLVSPKTTERGSSSSYLLE